MKYSFLLFNYFPFGGLERDFLEISKMSLSRGHSIDVYTMKWDGARFPGLNVNVIPSPGFSNHSQCAGFVKKTGQLDMVKYDLIVGFNKMPGLDLYYAADVCYEARLLRQRSFLSRFTPRHQVFATLEKAVFAPQSSTKIIYLAEPEKENYQGIYGTPDERFYCAPPGVDKNRISVNGKKRREVRLKMGLANNDIFLLMIGSHFETKGLDRSIRAIAALPVDLRKRSHLFVIGKGKSKPYQKLAVRLGISEHLTFLGAQDDIASFLAGADYLLQPSVTENTGNTIVEALVAGLPVLATRACGYADHILKAEAGMVTRKKPFCQEEMNDLLQKMLCFENVALWRRNALAYADKTDLYNRSLVVAKLIEKIALEKKAG